MGFLRLPKPKKMSKKRVVAADLAKKSEKDEPRRDVDSSTRTCDAAGRDGESRLTASALHLHDQVRRDADLHERDALDLVQRRLSDRSRRRSSRGSSSSAASRVSFVDEELGLTPRHVVTQIRYRPRTTSSEKPGLYYNRKDFDLFEKEELFELIQEKIRQMESGAADAMLETEVRDLMIRVQQLQ